MLWTDIKAVLHFEIIYNVACSDPFTEGKTEFVHSCFYNVYNNEQILLTLAKVIVFIIYEISSYDFACFNNEG